MNRIVNKNIIIILLLTITLFSIFKYISYLKEKYNLLDSLKQTKEQVALLEQEKQNLLVALEKEKELEKQLAQEKSELKDNLKASRIRLSKLFRQARETQKAIDQLNSNFALLKAENTALLEQDAKAKLKLSQLSEENEGLKARLNSIAELKKAIAELKRQMFNVGVKIIKKSDDQRTLEGNRGFLIKNGKFTYPAKVKIEVVPVTPAKQ